MAKILIVDDDTAMVRFLETALQSVGHDVQTEENPLNALQMLQQATHFDLLLTDIIMPGMDGIELSQAAKALNPDMKIMFMTGFTGLALQDRNPENTGNPTLSKPFHLKDLIKNIEQALKD